MMNIEEIPLLKNRDSIDTTVNNK